MGTIVQLNPLLFVVFVVPFAVCSSEIIFSLHMRQQFQFSSSSYDLSLMNYYQSSASEEQVIDLAQLIVS
jgi:hypothetical protein